MYVVAIYFGGNILAQQLRATGAFEVFLNNKQVSHLVNFTMKYQIFSKIETGKVPNSQYIYELIKREKI